MIDCQRVTTGEKGVILMEGGRDRTYRGDVASPGAEKMKGEGRERNGGGYDG